MNDASIHNSLKTSAGKAYGAWFAWLAGALSATALFACLWFFGEIHFAGNDDVCILRPFMGYLGGQIPTFHLYLHPILVYPLYWLGTAFPGVPWYSWMQLLFLWLSCAVIVKSLVKCFQNAGRSPWAGLAAGLAFVIVYPMTHCGAVTYTLTAAILGGAAVLQILSVDCARSGTGKIVRGMLLSLLLVVLAYGLRQITALPILAFCALAFLLQGTRAYGLGRGARGSWKPLMISALIVAVVMGALVGAREWEIDRKGMGDYLRWQRARIDVMDYTGLDDLPDELLDELGWTRAETRLVGQWYFMDANVTAEAFEKIAAYQREAKGDGLAERVKTALAEINAFVQKDWLGMRSLWLLFGAAALCALALMLGRERATWRWITLLLSALLFAALIAYLSLQGRLPLRAVMMVAFPAAGLVWGLLPQCLPKRGALPGARRAALTAAACVCAVLLAWYAVPAVRSLAPAKAEEGGEESLNACADLDEYALDNPDMLFISDFTMVMDERMFPNTEYGVPSNVLFWGGWSARSPEFAAALEAFGIDAETADASIFLNEDVRLARGALDPPPTDLLERVAEVAQTEVDYTFDSDWGGAHMLQIYSYE